MIHDVVLIGAGNLATHIARACRESGFKVKAVYSRSQANAELLAGQVKAQAVSDFADLPQSADLYIIAVSDGAISAVSAQLAGVSGIVVHTSGNTPMNVLSAHDRYGVLYPLQTFSKGIAIDLKTVPFCIEGNAPDVCHKLYNIAGCLSHNVFEFDSEQRRYLHLAAVLVNNFTNAMLDIAGCISAERDIPFELFRPLAEETINKAFQTSPRRAQTGPAVRKDTATMQGHHALINTLRHADHDRLKRLYDTVSSIIYDLQQQRDDSDGRDEMQEDPAFP